MAERKRRAASPKRRRVRACNNSNNNNALSELPLNDDTLALALTWSLLIDGELSLDHPPVIYVNAPFLARDHKWGWYSRHVMPLRAVSRQFNRVALRIIKYQERIIEFTHSGPQRWMRSHGADDPTTIALRTCASMSEHVRRLMLTHRTTLAIVDALCGGAPTHQRHFAHLRRLDVVGTEATLAHSTLLSSLTALNTMCLWQSDATDATLQQLTPQLTCLQVGNCEHMLGSALASLSHLTTLRVLNWHGKHSNNGFLHLLPTTLEQLDINIDGAHVLHTSALTPLVNLTRLHAYGAYSMSGASDRLPPHLVKLNLCGCATVRDELLAPLIRLRDLCVARATQLTGASFAHLANIEYLDVHCCMHVSDSAIASLETATQLTHLNIEHCSQITDAANISRLTRLHTLYATNCEQVSNASIASLLALTDMAVRGTRITPDAVLQLPHVAFVTIDFGGRMHYTREALLAAMAMT